MNKIAFLADKIISLKQLPFSVHVSIQQSIFNHNQLYNKQDPVTVLLGEIQTKEKHFNGCLNLSEFLSNIQKKVLITTATVYMTKTDLKSSSSMHTLQERIREKKMNKRSWKYVPTNQRQINMQYLFTREFSRVALHNYSYMSNRYSHMVFLEFTCILHIWIVEKDHVD